MDWYKTAAKRIADERKKKGLTQKELAEKLSVHREDVKNWECYTRKPTVDMLIKLSELFDVTVDYLVGKSESELPSESNITILANKFGFSAKAARELSVLSNPANGGWAQHRFKALNRLIEAADEFEGLLICLWNCMTFAKRKTPYETELIKQGREIKHTDGFVTEEELYALDAREMMKSAVIFRPQHILAGLAEQFVKESEETAERERGASNAVNAEENE